MLLLKNFNITHPIAHYRYNWSNYSLTYYELGTYALIFLISNIKTGDVIAHFIDKTFDFQSGDSFTSILERNENLLIINVGDVYSTICIEKI